MPTAIFTDIPSQAVLSVNPALTIMKESVFSQNNAYQIVFKEVFFKNNFEI